MILAEVDVYYLVGHVRNKKSISAINILPNRLHFRQCARLINFYNNNAYWFKLCLNSLHSLLKNKCLHC